MSGQAYVKYFFKSFVKYLKFKGTKAKICDEFQLIKFYLYAVVRGKKEKEKKKKSKSGAKEDWVP